MKRCVQRGRLYDRLARAGLLVTADIVRPRLDEFGQAAGTVETIGQVEGYLYTERLAIGHSLDIPGLLAKAGSGSRMMALNPWPLPDARAGDELRLKSGRRYRIDAVTDQLGLSVTYFLTEIAP